MELSGKWLVEAVLHLFVDIYHRKESLRDCILEIAVKEYTAYTSMFDIGTREYVSLDEFIEQIYNFMLESVRK